MALGNRVKSDALTTVYDNEVYPVGTYFVQQADEVVGDDSLQGDRTWLFVEANSDITANSLCQRDSSTHSFKAAESASSNDIELMNLIGVAPHAIASGKYGWIVIRGETSVKATAGAAGNNLTSVTGATGRAGPATGGATDSFAVFGRAIAGHSGGTIKCFVDFRG
jgi:hypothetical protein